MRRSRFRGAVTGQRRAETVLDDLLRDASIAAPYQLADLINNCARGLGALRAVAYLADLQQQVLVPFLAPGWPTDDGSPTELSVDSTLAGRAYQTFDMQVQEESASGTLVWLPLLVSTHRIGVLAVTFSDRTALAGKNGQSTAVLTRFATLTAALLVSKAPYGDTLVRLRRRSEMGLAAEIQWSLLPPLTFVSDAVTMAAALEPAYDVAGDTIDYSVDAGITRVAIFDGMGHGLQSAQCAVLALSAYRNARRSGRSLTETLGVLENALVEALGGQVFTTAVLAEINTRNGQVHWVNAGHPEPLLLRGGRLIRPLHIEPRPPIGLGYGPDTHPVTVGTEQLEPGDRILLFTDGVVDARSPTGEFFGVDRLTDLVLRHLAGGLPAPETMRRVVRELLDHRHDQLRDDATMLLVEWRSDNAEAVLTSPAPGSQAAGAGSNSSRRTP